MAADFTGNPIVINAADVTGLAAVSGSGNNPGDVISVAAVFYLVVWRGAMHILNAEMEDYTLDTDTAILLRYNTKVFWDANGSADLQTVRSGNIGWTHDGLLVPNNGITHGNLRIFYA